MIGTEFTFDGRECSEFGLYVVRTDSGLITTPYASNKNILEEHPKKVITPYFFGVQHQPLNFVVKFSLLENDLFDSDKLYEIANWLFQDTYKPLISEDNEGKIYYCMAVNKIDFLTTGLRDGIIEVEFRCRDAFGWTAPVEYEFDLSANIGSTPTTVQINNLSNVGVEFYYPTFEFTLQSTDTAVSIKSMNDDGRLCSFSSLSVGETIYMDNQKKIITSDTNNYRFDKWNKTWFRLVKGVNNIEITGKCIITFTAQYPIIS